MEQQNSNQGAQPKTDAPEVKGEGTKTPPKSAPQKKELTPAQMQKRRKMLVMPLFFLVFCGAMWLIFAPSKKDKGETAGQDGFNAELPIPKDEAIYSDKRTAYEQEAWRERRQDKIRSLQDFSSMFEESGQQREEEYYEAPEPQQSGTSSRSVNSIHSSAVAYEDINRQLGAWYDEPATEVDEQAQLAVEWRVQELERRLEEAEREKAARNEQEALLEKSYQMAARYMPQEAQPARQEQTGETSLPASGTNQKMQVEPVSAVHSSVVSLLLAPMSDEEFIDAFSRPRNIGFLTAAGSEGTERKNTIRASVYQTTTIVSGRELQIRLLEPMRAGNITIPANSVITGACRIGGERMEVTVNSIQYAGNIIPVELQVYDMDGQRGIFVPNSDEINAAKEIATQMAQSAGTSITITDDAGSQFAADMGKSLIQGASQYVSKKMSVVKVTLKANYQILLLPKTQ